MNEPIEKKRFSPRVPRAAVPKMDSPNESYAKAYPGETEVVKVTLHRSHAALLRSLAIAGGVAIHQDDVVCLLLLGFNALRGEARAAFIKGMLVSYSEFVFKDG